MRNRIVDRRIYNLYDKTNKLTHKQKRYQMAIKDYGMKTIHSFLTDCVYYIPDYQREYSWDKGDQLEDFWQDLKNALEIERSHFFGQVVIHESKDGKKYIIDGQQRTCTTVILLAVLRDRFSVYADNDEEAQNKKEDIRVKYIGRWTAKNNELQLHIGVSDREYFKENIQKSRPSGEVKTPAQRRIKEAYEFFDKKFSELFNDISDDNEKVELLLDYYNTLLHKFNLMVIKTDDINEAFIIFETLNARGKDLETADLLKNYVFMQSGANIDSIKNKWVSMYDILDRKEDATKLIRYYWNSGHDFVREKNLYKEISIKIKPNKCNGFVTDLCKMAELYNGLTAPDDNKYFNDNDITECLINLSIMKTATFYPIIMAMVLSGYSEMDIKKVAKALEVLAFRNFVVAGLTANRYEVIFAKIAKTITLEHLTCDKIIEMITEETVDDDKFKRDLIGLQVKTVATAKYILREIEDYNSNEKKTSKNNKIINLEHIMPKKNTLWQVPEEEHQKYLYRLANQTLLLDEYNKSISNKIFSIKKGMYEKSQIEITKDLCQYDEWNSSAIQDRESKLNDIIIRRWALIK